MKKIIRAVGVLGVVGVLGMAMTSCNVTRVITNESQYLQKGDTSIVIQTKTIETYNAEKH